MSRDYIHVYDQNIQTPSSLKLLGQSKPNFLGASLGRGNESLYKWSRSYDQDGRHGYIYQKPLKIFFFRTRRPMILKQLGMKHQGIELYNVCINHDPRTARST